MKWVNRIIQYFNYDIWKIHAEKYPLFKRILIHITRFLMLIFNGITKREFQEKASILAYYTLVSLVPVLAFLLVLSKSFLLEDTFINFLQKQAPGQKEMINNFLFFASQAVEATSKKAIATLGVLVFLWSSFKILNHLEIAMNTTFEAVADRPFLRRLTDYLAVFFIVPVFLTVSVGVTVYLSTKPHFFQGDSGFLQEIGMLYYLILNILPYLLLSFLFTFLYLFLPNTTVDFFSALTGGIIAAIVYQIFQIIYFYVQIETSKHNPVLGTVAGIPLFLIWLQISWLIFFLGSKITFLLQHRDSLEFLTKQFNLSHASKEMFSLLITHFCIKEFCLGHVPPKALTISKKLKISNMLTKTILLDLIASGVILEVKYPHSDEIGYHPAVDVEQLTIKKVLDMINKNGDAISLPHTPVAVKIQKHLKEFIRIIEHSPHNIALKNIS